MNTDHDKNPYEMEFSNNWLITYSDMITIILCFFIVFFTYSSQEISALYDTKNALTDQISQLHAQNQKLKTEKENLAAQLFGLTNIEKDIKTSKEDFISFLRENNLLDQVNIIENEKGLLIRFKDSVLFGSGEADITQKGYAVLDEIGDKLGTIDHNIIVEGYTDNVPISTPEFPSNWELSVSRAIQVVKFFTEKKSISAQRITVSGYGERNPIDTNETPEGRANNRRIEITIVD
ncbi:MAG: OmpA family protein [Bacillota bacterium]